MTHKRLGVLLSTVLGVAALALAPTALAEDPPAAGPPSGDGVTATVVGGNVDCTALNAMDGDFPAITSNFGFKVEGDYNRTVPPDGTASGTFPTGGAPADSGNTITLSSADGVFFDWSSTLGIDAVIVKASSYSNTFVYVPEDDADTALHGPVNPNTGQPYEISHLEFCYDYELTASKTASAKYKRTYSWQIVKDFDGQYSKFIGDPATSHGYKVSVDRIATDSDWTVEGTITVKNPSPMTVSFLVTDSVGGTGATVTCPALSLAPGGEVTCTYTAALGAATNGTNTATITSTTLGVGGASAGAAYAFGDPTTEAGHKTVDVTDTNGGAWTASGDASWEYGRDFTCPTDTSLYVKGVYTAPDHVNTATITQTGQSDTATVKLTCYAPLVSKNATAEWTKKYEWSIGKSVTPAAHSGFAGDSFSSDYDIKVDQTVTDYGFKAFGKIFVQNPNPSSAMTVDVADAVDGTAATVDCGSGSTSLTVAAGQTGSCDYTVALSDNTDRTNTATVTLNSIGFTATAAVDFGEPTKIEGYPSVDVTDTFPYPGGTPEALGSASGDTELDNDQSFACSTNPADYTNGTYSYTKTNRAQITETGQSDQTTVTVTCYAPVVTKTASAGYDETHTWSIEKSVNPTTQSGYPGDVLGWEWKVDVSETSADGNFAVSGTISVENPNPNAAMTVDVSDVLNDGTTATVDCGSGSTSLTVAAGQTGSCNYSAAPTGKTATLNTATATLNGGSFTGTHAVSFVKNVIGGSAVVDDDTEGSFPVTVNAGGGPWSWTEPGSHTCSSSYAAYGSDGTYSDSVVNNATVTASNGQTDTAQATTTYTCNAGFVDLLKLTDGVVDASQTWQFKLFAGPDGYGTMQVGSTSSTSGDADGVLEFGAPALNPTKTYTVCEVGVAAGWTSLWQVDTGSGFVTVIPYNPDADNVPPEDLGNRCVDFGANTTIPVTVGATVHFRVDNTYPGGAPRTPGYWKNWNECTGGNQAATAEKNGGWQEGFWLLEDVLDPTIGGGVAWGGFVIDDCEEAVAILNDRDIATGKKMASDPGYTLAKHLLAAQLNLGAGACNPTGDIYGEMTLNEVVIAAETLLVNSSYDGIGASGLKKGPDTTTALQLAKVLDEYNNGKYCGGSA